MNLTMQDIIEEIQDSTLKYTRADLIQIIVEGLEQDDLPNAVLNMFNSVEDTKLYLTDEFKLVELT